MDKTIDRSDSRGTWAPVPARRASALLGAGVWLLAGSSCSPSHPPDCPRSTATPVAAPSTPSSASGSSTLRGCDVYPPPSPNERKALWLVEGGSSITEVRDFVQHTCLREALCQYALVLVQHRDGDIEGFREGATRLLDILDGSSSCRACSIMIARDVAFSFLTERPTDRARADEFVGRACSSLHGNPLRDWQRHPTRLPDGVDPCMLASPDTERGRIELDMWSSQQALCDGDDRDSVRGTFRALRARQGP